MNTLDSLKLDKTVLTVVSLNDQSDDKAYWHARSPYERMQAVEALRQLNYGHRQSAARLQRVLEVTQRAQVKYLLIGDYAALANDERVLR